MLVDLFLGVNGGSCWRRKGRLRLTDDEAARREDEGRRKGGK